PPPSRTPLQQAFEFLQRQRWRQRLACFFQRLNRLFNEFAKLREHLLGIVAVWAWWRFRPPQFRLPRAPC
ncbi:MAG: hypothetical protein ACK559_37295, partial [bacterium]